MIHLLKVTSSMSTSELKKLSRRYAMTGGYELELAQNLGGEDLELLVAKYLPEAESYPAGSALQQSSNAFRILMLASRHPALKAETQEKFNHLIGR